MGTESNKRETLAIHAGQAPDPVHGAVMQPIVLASTFAQPSPGEHLGFDYSRSGNPTRNALEGCLAALEGAKHGLAFASGCAATTTLLMTLNPGDHVVCGDDVYGGTFRIFQKVAEPKGIQSSFLDLSDLAQVRQAIRPETKAIWLESPTNPLLKIFPIEALCKLAKEHGLMVVVDNTFATPMLQQPLALGADVVLHSTTKYINGHSDAVGGFLCTNDGAIHDSLRFLQNAMGAIPSPFDCYMVLRGVKTLPVRMKQHVASARDLAQRLEASGRVRKVVYPFLESHPQCALAKEQMSGGGGMISLDLGDTSEVAKNFLEALKIFALAESLGGVESLAESPPLMTHASLPEEQFAALGMSRGLVRLSVGLENVEDLFEDLDQALKAANM